MALTIPILTEFSGKGIDKARQEFKQLETKTQKFAFAMKKALLPAIAVLGGLATAAGKALKAGEDMATANARTAQIAETLGIFGNEAETVSNRLNKLAEQQARNIGVSNLQIKSQNAQLLTFKKLAKSATTVGGVFDRASLAVLDMQAANVGGASAAIALGKALEDPIKGITALGRSGVTFNEQEKKKIRVLVESNKMLEAQQTILAAVEGQVGGTAAATANDTLKMKEGFAQVTQSLGMSLLPILEAVTPLILGFADWARENPGTFKIIAGAIGAIAAAVVAINVAIALGPFGLIAVGLVAVGGLVFAAYKRFETFRNIVDAVFGAFQAVGKWLAANWSTIMGYVTGPIGIVVTAFNTLKDIAIEVFQAIGKAIDRVLGPLKKIIDGVGAVAGVIGGGISAVGGALRIPGFAQGGIVTRPTLAMVGEGGEPEFIIPASKMPDMLASYGAGMGGGNNVTINVSGGDPQAVVDALRRYMYQNGNIPIRVTG